MPVNSAEVAAALRNVESALIPAAPAMVAMLITQTMQLYGTPANWAAIADFYLEAFEDVPQDLVGVAMKRCRRECKFMPRPAELRDLIASELSERRLALARLRHAQWRSEHPVG